jgi:predicted methyltransferase
VRLLPVAICLALLAVAGCSQRHDMPDLTSRLASGERPDEDKARDAGRRPGEVVTFLGIEPGMTVIDVIASGGYYSEVLSEAVGPDGKVYAQNIDYVLKLRDGASEKAISARLEGGRLPNVERLDREFDDLGLEPESVDAIVTALNFHDVLDGRGPEAAQSLLTALKSVLKPGGVLGLIDHAGIPGQDEANKKLHRIDEARVVAAVEAAGFNVEATSSLLRNPADDQKQSVFAKGLRGHTDRFVLLLRKPR